jgi:hypothetical protein
MTIPIDRLSDRLRQAMRECGKSPAEIATEAWLPTSAVESFLAGRTPTADELGLFARAAGTSIGILCTAIVRETSNDDMSKMRPYRPLPAWFDFGTCFAIGLIYLLALLGKAAANHMALLVILLGLRDIYTTARNWPRDSAFATGRAI